jgi:hypothetical protein
VKLGDLMQDVVVVHHSDWKAQPPPLHGFDWAKKSIPVVQMQELRTLPNGMPVQYAPTRASAVAVVPITLSMVEKSLKKLGDKIRADPTSNALFLVESLTKTLDSAGRTAPLRMDGGKDNSKSTKRHREYNERT